MTEKKNPIGNCPVCKAPMKACGAIKVKNPATNRERMCEVIRCTRCGYRSMR